MYLELLDEIKKYAKNRITADKNITAFVPSKPDLKKTYNNLSYIDLNLYSENSVIEGLKIYVKNQMHVLTDAIKGYYIQAIQTIDPKNPNFERFAEELYKIRDKMKEATSENIDTVFNYIIELAKKFPDDATAILAVSKTYDALLNNFLTQIFEFTNSLSINIIELLKTQKIWGFIEDNFNKIIQEIDNWPLLSPK